MKQFNGIYTALVTPYTKSGEVDFVELHHLVEKLISDEADGFYLTGSTGECFFLSTEERKSIVQEVVKQVAHRVKVIVHVGCIGTDHSVELAKHAEQCGADAVSAIPPFYYKYSFEEIKAHYFTIMDATSLPMFVYNFPALSGIEFTVAQISEFAAHKNFGGVKHTSKDLFQLQQIKKACPDITVFNGHDEVFLASLAMGADGAIGSTFNLMTPRFKRMMKLFNENEIEQAQKEQVQANEVIGELIASGVNQGIKYLLEGYGVLCNGCRPPMKKVTQESCARLDAIRHLLI